jgi:hypothetical protein
MVAKAQPAVTAQESMHTFRLLVLMILIVFVALRRYPVPQVTAYVFPSEVLYVLPKSLQEPGETIFAEVNPGVVTIPRDTSLRR